MPQGPFGRLGRSRTFKKALSVESKPTKKQTDDSKKTLIPTGIKLPGFIVSSIEVAIAAKPKSTPWFSNYTQSLSYAS